MNQQQQPASTGQSTGTMYIEVPENEDDLIIQLSNLLKPNKNSPGPVVIKIRVDVISMEEHSISTWNFRRPSYRKIEPGQ